MNITKQDIDTLNAVINIEIDKTDYQEKVEKTLKDYRKNATVKGFRKGHVAMGLIKRKYEKAVIMDEVNKLLKEALNNFLTEEKLDILGNPIPKKDENFSLENDRLSFEFELGIAPEFEIDLTNAEKKVTRYEITTDEPFIDNEIMNIRKRYGTFVSQNEVTEESYVSGTFTYEYQDEKKEKNAEISIERVKGKTNKKKLLGKKKEDTISLKTKGLFLEDHDLIHTLNISHEEIHDIDIPLTFKITQINRTEPAQLNQDLFDKAFGKDKITSEEELRKSMKENFQNQCAGLADQRFLSDVTDYFLESVQFELPEEFLKKWLQTKEEKTLSPEEVAEKYKDMEKPLRYQLIESKLSKEHDIEVSFEELKTQARMLLLSRIFQHQQELPEEELLDEMIYKMLADKEQVRNLSEQVMNKKLLDFYKENLNYKKKEISYEDFMKKIY